MTRRRARLSARAAAFLAESHLGTLTTLRPNNSPHVTAVRFTWDPTSDLARVLTPGSATAYTPTSAGTDRRRRPHPTAS